MKQLLLSLVVFVTMVLSGCELVQLSEVQVALENMEELDSYRMDIAVHLGAQSETMYAEVKDDFVRMYIDDVTIEYVVKDDGAYTPTRLQYGMIVLERNEELSLEGEYDDFAFYKQYDFEKEDEYYVFEGGEMEGMDELSTTKLRLENERVREIVIDGYLNREHLRIVIVFSMFNQVDLDVPTYPSQADIDALEATMATLNITDGGSGIGVVLFVTDHFHMTCHQQTDRCFIETDPFLEYDLVTRQISSFQSEQWWDIDDYLDTHETPGLTMAHFDFLHQYEALYRRYQDSNKEG